MKRFFGLAPVFAFIVAASSVGYVSIAQADLFGTKPLAVGFQSNGPSVKVPIRENIKGQWMLGALDALTTVEARGLRTLASNDSVDFYSYGSVGMWFWDGDHDHDAEATFSAGLGLGLDYDIRHAIPDMPAVFVSAEVGASFVSFDHYDASDAVSVGLGVHYQF